MLASMLLSSGIATLASMMLVLSSVGAALVGRRHGSTTCEVDVDSSSILFGVVLKAKFVADLLDSRLDSLDMIYRVVALANDTGRISNISSFTLPGENLTREGASGHVAVHIESVVPRCLQPPRRTDRASQWYRPQHDQAHCSRGR